MFLHIMQNIFENLLWAVLIGVTVFVLSMVLLPIRRLRAKSLRLAHGVRSPATHWLFGHLKMLPATESGLLRSADRARNFPAMCINWFGPVIAALECYHPDTVKPLLAKTVPKATFAYEFLRPWLGNSILLSEGDRWKRKRKLLSSAFNSKALESYIPTFNEVADIMHEKLKNDGTLQEISEIVGLMTLDAVLRSLVSRRMDPQNKSSESLQFAQAIRSLNDMIIQRIMRIHTWNDTVFRCTELGKNFYIACDVVHKEAERIIQLRRLARAQEKSGVCNNAKPAVDFLDILIEEGKDENGNELTDEEIRGELDTFLFAGHDTTSSAISWTIYNLARHPQFQEKCFRELRETVSDYDRIEWSEIPKLRYLNQCINESMRLYPPITGVGRCPSKPMTMSSRYDENSAPKTVPANSFINVRIFDLHRHPDIWEHPHEYDPERFSKENVSKRPPCSFIPFSQGSRNCIGQTFAMTLATVVIGRILLRHQLFVDDDTPAAVMNPGVVLRPKNGIHIKIWERGSV